MRPYFFHISPYELASLGTLFSGLTLALLLGFVKRGQTANLFLSLALAVIVLKIVGLTPFLFPALGSLLYFYSRKLTCPDRRFRRKDMLYFSPLLIGYWMPDWLVLISVIICLYLSHRLIEDFYRRLRPVLTDRPRFAFRRLNRALLLLGLFCVLSLVSDTFYLALALVLIGMAVEAILKPGNDVQLAMPITDRSDAREKGRRLKEAVAANRLYEDAELTLTTLAIKLAIHPHDLSRIINIGLEKNFSDFINEFRVREVARKMREPAYDRLTLLGIAYESGFNSQRTFNRVFKEITGKTPVEYKNSLKKVWPIDQLAISSRTRPVILRSESPPVWAAATLKRNVMIKNYLKIAWRNTISNKVYSALNITGLAAGIAVTLLIALWAWREYSYDRFLPNYTQLYQIKLNFNQNGDIQTQNGGCLPIAGALRSNFPEVKYVAETGWTSRHSLIVGDKKLYQKGMIVGHDFLKMFQFHLLSGNAATVLNEPFSIILTQSAAKALFGNDDPIGKVVRIDNAHDVKVAGLMDNLPDNSTLQFSFLLPFSYWEQTEPWVKAARADWTHYPFDQYVELQPGVTEVQFAPKIKNLLKGRDPIHKVEIVLQPVKNWHLYSEFKNGKASGGFIVFVRMFCIIGALVLLIACINFVNLFTARSEKRAREVGVRKAIGSNRANLIFQFLTESVLVTFIAALFAIAIVQVSLPGFNSLTGNSLKIPYAAPLFWISLLVFVLFTGVMAGSRPAFYLSSFNPVKVLRGTLQLGKAAALPRKILVVIQFTCSIALIIGTIIIYQQISHVKSRPTGYDADRLIMTTITPDLNRNYIALKNDLLQSGFVANVTRASSPIPVIDFQASCNLLNWPGKNSAEPLGISYAAVSEDFFKTADMKMKEGREFEGTPNDTLNVILNEAAVGKLGLKTPLGQMLTTELTKAPVRIIGVVRNAVIGSPFSAIQPALFVYNPDLSGTVIYRLKPVVNVQDAISKLARIFNKYNPAYPYDYQFADATYDSKFKQAQLVGKLSAVFAGLTILISCLGLFGLAAYMAEQRTREIGVRKVLGASLGSIWLLLSRDFMVLVIIGCVVASPLAFYFMNNWLQQYDYRISIGPWVFILSALIAIVITLITISFQSIKAALANPVKSLRSE
ncbi:ABC transporter permease [Mucilaginibacter angelicae]|uniref:ABC transporter permease n=1 Tax=Mucilaginibacter angelicae TaxID=869718 RepID=A0ABV6L991_9SPHI